MQICTLHTRGYVQKSYTKQVKRESSAAPERISRPLRRSVLCSVRSGVCHVGRVDGSNRSVRVRRRHAARCAPSGLRPGAPFTPFASVQRERQRRDRPLADGGRRHSWHARHRFLLPRSANGGGRPLPLRRLHPRENRLGLLLRGLQGTACQLSFWRRSSASVISPSSLQTPRTFCAMSLVLTSKYEAHTYIHFYCKCCNNKSVRTI